MEGFVRLAPDIYRMAVPFPGCWTGVTLVRGKENILVDSGGMAQTVDENIVPALGELGLTLSDITWLALTHTHGDHVGGAVRMLELNPQLKIAAFEDSYDRVCDPLTYSKAIRAKFPEHSPAAPSSLRGVTPDLLLKDGQKVGELTLIHTPGHDTDSCCFFDERTGTLITGDSLQLNGTVSQGCALLMDAEGYGKTLLRLRSMKIQNIVCGHPYLPLGADAIGEDSAREYLAACAACDAHDRGFVHGMMAAGYTDAAEIACRLIDEVGGKRPEKLFLPMYTVTQYMQK